MPTNKEVQRQDELLRIIGVSEESQLFNKRSVNPESNSGEAFYFRNAAITQRRNDNTADQWINEYNQISRHIHRDNENMHHPFYSIIHEHPEHPDDRPRDDEDMALAARNLLQELERDGDEKLTSSNFVAYLKSLAGTSVPSNATAILNEGTASDGWDEWNSVSGNWNSTRTNGYGYGGFSGRITAYLFHDAASTSNHDSILLRMIALEQDLSDSQSGHDAWWELGKLNSMYGDDTNALAAFSHAIKYHRDALLNYASSCINLSFTQDAIDAIGRWHFGGETPPNCTTAELIRLIQESDGQQASLAVGLLYLIGDNVEAALHVFESIPNSDAMSTIDVPENMNRIGAMNANLGNYDGALECYKRAIAASPHSECYLKAFENIAISYFCLGKCQDAQEWMEKANTCDNRTETSKQSAAEIRNIICGHQSK